MNDRSIQQYVDEQHERLDLRLSTSAAALRAGNVAEARRGLDGFRSHLDRYVHGEERWLFPMYDHLPMALHGPTSRMRLEHAHLCRMAARLDGLLGGEDLAAAISEIGTLRSLLLVHHTKEDWVIYARVADLTTSAVTAGLLDDLDAARRFP